MAAYIVIRSQVHDSEAYAKFVETAEAVSAKSGGEFLVRARRCVPLEGEEPDVVVIQRFPNLAAAEAFYDNAEYREALRLAGKSFTRDVVIVEGVSSA